MGHQRTWQPRNSTSVLLPKADSGRTSGHVRLVPLKADIAEYGRHVRFVQQLTSAWEGHRSSKVGIEQAVRAITGRLIPQLPAGRRFRRTLLFGRGRRRASRAAAPIARIGRYGCGVGHRAARLVLR